ncbi:MAG: transglutaminaseTgpA domain-containing protein [Acidimicrobiales bacterium]
MTGPRATGPIRPPTPHPDRVTAAGWTYGALLTASIVAAALAGQTTVQGQVSPTVGLLVGAAVALLAVAGLRSLSIRLVTRTILLLSAVLMVRFGVLAGSLVGGGQALLGWLVAAVVVLVVTDRLGTELNPGLQPGGGAGRTRAATTARTVVVVSAIVVLLAVLVAPALLPHVGNRTEAGSGPRLGRDGGASLRSSDRLDMTRRPELTNEVLFTVESKAATFWRGETFDRWNGHAWTRSDRFVTRLAPDGAVRAAPDDLAAGGPDRLVQRFRIRAQYADVVYAAATASSVSIDAVAGQRDDATLVSAPLGNGATYTVTSRRIPLTVERLRAAAGPVPADVVTRYAQAPVATDRVRSAATRVTQGATNTYDKVRALEAWMGARTKYSLDAPLAPQGVDVVDHFLFSSRQGWCEQVASSLVVLARANGIPARLATGFVPDERDPVTGTFTVRARDAHSWAEVWFPELGWVPFDPTAQVPLAGKDRSKATAGGWLADHALMLLAGLAVLAVAAGPGRGLVRGWRARRAARPRTWAALADARLARLGDKAGRPRQVGETTTTFGDALALRYGDDRLSTIGRLVDDAVFAPVEVDEARCREADAVLADLAARKARDLLPAQ